MWDSCGKHNHGVYTPHVFQWRHEFVVFLRGRESKAGLPHLLEPSPWLRREARRHGVGHGQQEGTGRGRVRAPRHGVPPPPSSFAFFFPPEAFEDFNSGAAGCRCG